MGSNIFTYIYLFQLINFFSAFFNYRDITIIIVNFNKYIFFDFISHNTHFFIIKNVIDVYS